MEGATKTFTTLRLFRMTGNLIRAVNRADGINQVECPWSLLNPWLAKFRGLSKPGLEQSVRTYGLVRRLNLAGAPLHGLLDCFVVERG